MEATVRNRLNAPLVMNVPEQEALYLLAREERPLDDVQFNAPEVKEQIAAGNLLVLRLE